MRRIAWVMACTLLAILLAHPAHAHEAGLSRGEYAWQRGSVLVAVTFSQRELASNLAWLSHGDGPGPLAFEEQRERLGRWLLEGLSVEGDRVACPASFDGMRLDGDGVALAASYTCAADILELTITPRFVAELARGHRHLAHLEVDERDEERIATAGNVSFTFPLRARTAPGSAKVGFGAFFRLGVEHILTGYDHLLFLLGLVLIGRPIRSLVGAITAFTVAHSVTLAVAAFGVWSPPARFIEPCIALSIAYVGIENWFVNDATGRWRITFPFGLLHGFGFAGALREVAVPRPEVPVALLGFNLGVEAGQIAAMVALLPLVLAARQLTIWQRAGMRACTGAIAAIGIVWFFVRVTGAT